MDKRIMPEAIMGSHSQTCPAALTPALLSEDFKRNFADLDKVVRWSNPSDVMINLENQACDGKRIKASIKIKNQETLDNDVKKKTDMLESIDDALNKNEPSAIGYDAGFLNSIDRGRDPDWGHFSVIVGRRPGKDNQCEYLIRNSWGKNGCSSMTNPRLECKDGQVWVSRAELHANIFSATQLE